ncbi:extracellular solute-binding protein [Paractinoplanes lichenicola]|uniref:Extracellular solute-binding protein n=1 Tax=Paractinoplanes lichenicola TaxID=2802976 RepID=A0ABS1VEY9_9ACTN|nr:extracellular solute-binding protein [Actinoplanes lichenicola]MBL7253249.1 extracellular solute-binding protein [Actinoplanes lichenicola]
MKHLNRRTFLGLTAGVAGAAALGACSDSGSGKSNVPSGDNASVKLPDAAPRSPLPGQLTSTVPGVPAAYTQYPADPARTVTTPPGSGGEITTMQINFGAPPPASSRWQEAIDKELNARIKATLVSDADLAQKTQTYIAGGDIPDVFYLHLQKVPAALKYVQQGAFIELSKYIGGAAAKDYPNLAALPEITWRNSAVGGGLFGVPRAVPAANTGQPLFRGDWLAKLGGSAPTDADSLYAMLEAFSKGGNYAFGAITPWDQEFVLSMFGVPNQWRQNGDGTLVKDLETDEFAAALEYLAKLYQAGGFHPNAVGNGWSEAQDLWTSGKTGFFGGNILASMTYLRGTPIKGVADMVADIRPFIAPGRTSGAKPGFYEGPAGYGIFAIPSKLEKDEKKVRELLGVLNYFAAPFGSAEFTLINYGVLGHNYTVKDGIPTPSQDPARQAELAAQYLPSPGEASIYIPGPPNQSQQVQKYFEQVQPDLIPNPVMTKVSQTNISKGTTLENLVKDNFKQFVSGRRPLTELEEFRKTWREQGGDAVRREFQDAR